MISAQSQITKYKNHIKKHRVLDIGIWNLEFKSWDLIFTKPLRFVILILLLVISTSCSNKSFNTKEEMTAYIKNPENGYFQEKVIQDVYYSLLYKPTDLLVQQELGDSITKERISSLRNKYKKYLYFTLSLSKNGQELLNSKAGNRAEFGAMVNQLAFNMDQKVHLFTQKKDTLEILDYIYPRTYGMTPYTSMLFVFPRNQKLLKDDFLNLTIEDLGFYTGEVKFKVPITIIKNEIQLKYKE